MGIVDCNAKPFANSTGEITIESLLPAETYVVRVMVEGKPQGEELVVDTGVPGCSGSSGKKKRRGCVIS